MHQYLPYFTWQMSPTTMSPTGICTTSPARSTANLCSCSILFCRPRNCRSLRQSLNDVTSTTTITATSMAAPSIQPASFSLSSWPAPANKQSKHEYLTSRESNQNKVKGMSRGTRAKSQHLWCHYCTPVKYVWTTLLADITTEPSLSPSIANSRLTFSDCLSAPY